MYLSFSYLPSSGVSQQTKHFLTSLIQVFPVCIWQQANHNTKPVIVMVKLVIILWWFSMCCKPAKNPLVNRSSQSKEIHNPNKPIKNRGKYIQLMRREARENARARSHEWLAFSSDRIKKRHEVFQPIVYCSNAKLITFQHQSKKRCIYLICNYSRDTESPRRVAADSLQPKAQKSDCTGKKAQNYKNVRTQM